MIYLILIGLVFVGLGIAVLVLTHEKDSGDSRERLDNLQATKYSTDMTRFGARKESKAAAARTELLTNINLETEKLTETINHQTANEAARIRQEHTPVLLQQLQDKAIADHSLNMRLTDLAVDHNLDVPNFLEVQKQILMNEQQRLHESNLAADQIRMGVIAQMLQDHQQMSEVQSLIDGYLIQIAELSKGTLNGRAIPDSVVPEMIASRRESISAWEANRRGIQKRLLQTGDGQEADGYTDSDISGDIGETVEDDEQPLPDKKPRGRPRGSTTKRGGA